MGPMPQAAKETLETAAHPEWADVDHNRARNQHDHVCLRCASPHRLSRRETRCGKGPHLGRPRLRERSSQGSKRQTLI